MKRRREVVITRQERGVQFTRQFFQDKLCENEVKGSWYVKKRRRWWDNLKRIPSLSPSHFGSPKMSHRRMESKKEKEGEGHVRKIYGLKLFSSVFTFPLPFVQSNINEEQKSYMLKISFMPYRLIYFESYRCGSNATLCSSLVQLITRRNIHQ